MKKIVFLFLLFFLPVSVQAADSLWISLYMDRYGQLPWDIEDSVWAGITHLLYLGGDDASDMNGSTSPYWRPMINAADSILLTWSDGQNIVDSVSTIAHRWGKKAILAFGSTSASNADACLNDSAKVEVLCSAVVGFAQRHNYDGVDMDLEHGATAAQIGRAVRIMRRRLNQWGTDKLLTASCAFSEVSIWSSSLQDSMDQLNLMTYDMISNNDNVSAFNSPLYSPPASLSTSLHDWQDNWYGEWQAEGYEGQIQNGPRSFFEAGWDSSKIGAGVPLYGFIYQDISTPGVAQTGYSYIDFYDVVEGFDPIGGTPHWVDTSKVPWMGGTLTENAPGWWGEGGGYTTGVHFYITYEDSNSIRAKVNWVKQFNMGGLMIWCARNGYWSGGGYYKGSTNPLMRVMIDQVANPASESNPPDPPVATAGTNVTSSGFTANWNASSGATSYRLDVSLANNFSSYVTGWQDKTVAGTSDAVSGLSASTNYYYRVRAVNGDGTSDNSNTITATTSSSVSSARRRLLIRH